MNDLDIYDAFLLLIKLIFIILAIIHLYFYITTQNKSKFDTSVVFWRERVSFVFTFLTALLMLYLFRPWVNIKLDYETKFTLSFFALVLILTADWKTFVNESPVFKDIQRIV